MLEQIKQELLNNKPEKEKGADIKIRSFYLRHAKKAKVGITSDIAISEKGQNQTAVLGGTNNPLESGRKVYSSGVSRTKDTGEIFSTALGGDKTKEFKTRVRDELRGLYPTEFGKTYEELLKKYLKELLKDKNINEKQYNGLSDEEKLDLSEEAEEPLLDDYILGNIKELSEIYTPDAVAEQVSRSVNKDINMSKHLKSGSKIDLINVSHKTVIEPFLMKVTKLKNGSTPKKLTDIGGSMNFNEGFEIFVETDEQGIKTTKFYLYRLDQNKKNPEYIKKEINIDKNKLKEMAQLAINKE